MTEKHKSKLQLSPYEPENLFILNLPENIATELNEKFENKKTDDLKDIMFLDLDVEKRKGKFRWKDQLLYTKLYNLPCIIECLKTLDKKTYYKTGDISQLLICNQDISDKEDDNHTSSKNKKDKEKKFNWNHGITPPLKNVRKRRFRKIIKKKNLDLPQIEKEVRRLLQADNEAVDVKWEVVYEDATGAPLSGENMAKITSISSERVTGKDLKPGTTTELNGAKLEGQEGEQSLSALEDALAEGRGGSALVKEKLKLAETDIFGELLSSSSQGESDDEDKGDPIYKESNPNESVDKDLKESALFDDFAGEEDDDDGDQKLSDLEDKEWEAVPGDHDPDFNEEDSKFVEDEDLEEGSVHRIQPKIDDDDSFKQEENAMDGMASSSNDYNANKDGMSRKDEIKAELNLLRQKRTTHQIDLENIENPALRTRFQNMLDHLSKEEMLLLKELEIIESGL